MPQEITVVQCYQCQAFQTKIVTKSKKWTCVMCSEKQSLKKTFGTGNGKECRERVQQLNHARIATNEHTALELMEADEADCSNSPEDFEWSSQDAVVQSQVGHGTQDMKNVEDLSTSPGDGFEPSNRSNVSLSSKWAKYCDSEDDA